MRTIETGSDDPTSAVSGAPARPARFVLLGKGRTGSTMLIQALNSHPNITCFGAVFNRQVDFVDFSVDGYDNASEADRALRDRDAPSFLRDRIFSPEQRGCSAIGFKYRYGQANAYPGLLENLVDDVHLRIVHLQRKNVLRSMVSARVAQATGVWFQQAGAKLPERRLPRLTTRTALRAARSPLKALRRVRSLARPPQPAWKARREPVMISIEECLAEFQTIHQQADEHDRMFHDHPTLSIFYEDFLIDRKAAFDRVQTFLGVEPRPLSVTLQRQNPEPLRSLIANYDELYQAFRGTPAAAFFD